MSKGARSIKTLFSAAKRALKNAHAPYSGCRVACALSTKGGVFTGVNIENASYGGTVCAERVALWKAVSEGERKVEHVLVFVDQKHPWAPCGLCRQVMAEFLSPQTPVTLATGRGLGPTYTLEELLPHAFSKVMLKGVPRKS